MTDMATLLLAVIYIMFIEPGAEIQHDKPGRLPGV